MLDQFNKELPQQDHDHFSEDAPISKKKIAFALSGAAFALVFFLFLMGLFRTEDAPQTAKAQSTKKNSLVALDDLEDKISVLQKRLDRIEEDHAKILAQADMSLPESSITPAQESNRVSQPDIPSVTLETRQQAVSMTHQAIMNVVTKSANQNDQIALDIPSSTQPQVEDTPAATSQSTPVVRKTAPLQSRKNEIHSSSEPTERQPIRDVTQPFNYTVRKGDTLSKISKQFYGTPNHWQHIYEANRGRIQNIDNLKVGTVLTIPPKYPQPKKQTANRS